jgi:hypothetical protein
LPLLGLLCLLFGVQAVRAQVPLCSPVDAPNGSRLCVTLGFRDGKLIVDRQISKLNASPQFSRSLTGQTQDQVTTIFFDQLDRRLNDRKRPYQLALNAAEQAKDAANQLNDPLTAELRAFNGTWAAYREKFETWAVAPPTDPSAAPAQVRKSFAEVFGDDATTGDGLYAPLTTVDADLALIFNDNSFDIGFDLNTANFSFTVIDPITDWSLIDIRLPGVTNPSRLDKIRKKLAPLRGRIWNPPAIRAAISSYYRQLNLVPSVNVSSVTNGLLIAGKDLTSTSGAITVIEGSRIARIILPLPGNADRTTYNTDMDKVLYVLLADQDFRMFIKLRQQVLPAGTAAPADALNRTTIEYATLFKHPGPYLDSSTIQIQQLLLSQIGYMFSVPDAEGSDLTGRNVALDVQKIADAKQAPPQTPKTAPPTTTPGNVVTGHQQESDQKTDFAPRNAPETTKPAEPVKEKKNYLGGGLEYRPGQGIRVFGLGQRSHLGFPISGGSISATGGADGGGIGTVNYFADYVLFGKLHRRLSLQLSGGADSNPNRVMAGQEQDERRDSGSGRLEFEPFRDRRGSLLRFYAEGRRATVALRENSTLKTKQNLTTLDLGGLYLFQSREAEFPRRIRLEPVVRFGIPLGSTSPSYQRLTITGNIHQSLPRRLAADISGTLKIASSDTPMFELPSFGGADQVRGFRRDDALGRRLWSLQNEVWIPLPRTATDQDAGLRAFLRDNVRLAPFVDVGGLYAASGSTPGLRSGYGLGLRVIYNIVILKVDYAYGVGPAASNGSRGKFYFSIGSNLPF